MNKILNRLEVQCQSDLHDDFTRNLFAEAAVEIERLRKDAERYRWLRNDGDRSNSSYIARPLGVYGLGPRLYTHDALDAEIEHSRTVQRSCTTGTAMNGANT
jgi:hypothetical protein